MIFPVLSEDINADFAAEQTLRLLFSTKLDQNIVLREYYLRFFVGGHKRAQ
jgi:hypothetical protein